MITTHQLFRLTSAVLVCGLALLLSPARVRAQAQDADALAKSLANPVAALISVPFQGNLDSGYANDGWRSTLNIQPVVPIKLNEDWNLIQRVVLPYIYQEDIGSSGNESGFGDAVATSFFSPKAPTASGWIWGAGPVFLLPTATNGAFASKKWGRGKGGRGKGVIVQVSVFAPFETSPPGSSEILRSNRFETGTWLN